MRFLLMSGILASRSIVVEAKVSELAEKSEYWGPEFAVNDANTSLMIWWPEEWVEDKVKFKEFSKLLESEIKGVKVEEFNG